MLKRNAIDYHANLSKHYRDLPVSYAVCIFVDFDICRNIRIYHDSCRNIESQLYFSKNYSGEPARVMFWIWLKMRYNVLQFNSDHCISFYILPLKYETWFPKFKQSLHFTDRFWIVFWERHVTKHICTQKKEKTKKGEKKRKKGLEKITSEKRIPEWYGFFLRFTTFLIIWIHFSLRIKGEKCLPPLSFIWIDNNVAQRLYSISRDHSEVTGSWAFSVNNFCLRFHFLIT